MLCMYLSQSSPALDFAWDRSPDFAPPARGGAHLLGAQEKSEDGFDEETVCEEISQ